MRQTHLSHTKIFLTCASLALSSPLACNSSNESGSKPAEENGKDDAGQQAGSGGFIPDEMDDSHDDDMPDGSVPSSECGGDTIEADRRPANMLLVVDKSGSMSATPGGFEQSKWQAMRLALAEALEPQKEQLALGLEFFPFRADAEPGETGCALPEDPGINVEIAPGSTSLASIVDAFDSSEPDGGTPTAAALERARDYFLTGAGSALEGDRYVLLATDGGPNCNAKHEGCDAASCTLNIDQLCPEQAGNCCSEDYPDGPASCLDDASATDAVSKLAEAGIPTFVVGIPGSHEYASALDAMAVAGGVPNKAGDSKYFAVDDDGGVDALIDVFKRITSGLITQCRLQLASDPPDLRKLNVEIDGETVAQEGNWQLDVKTSPPTVELLGELCQQVESQGAQEIAVTFGCPTLKTAR